MTVGVSVKNRLYSYRFAEQILDHPDYRLLKDEVIEVIEDCPLPVSPASRPTSNGSTLYNRS
jgi:hypothetical protein